MRFESDPGYVHERILMWPLGPDTNRHWVVLTSHGDEYVEALSDWDDLFWLAGRGDGGGYYPLS